MVERSTSRGEKRRHDAQVIPFRQIGNGSPQAQAIGGVFRTHTRTLRPVDVLLLTPVILPAAALILLLLTAVFFLWLATVAVQVTMLVFADILRALMGRLSRSMLRTLDRRAISYQGR